MSRIDCVISSQWVNLSTHHVCVYYFVNTCLYIKSNLYYLALGAVVVGTAGSKEGSQLVKDIGADYVVSHR